MAFYIYFIIAGCLFIGELFTTEFSLLCLGIGAIATGILAWIGLNFLGQIISFFVVSIGCWIGIRPFALRYLYRNVKEIKTPAEDVIGQEAIVEITIDPIKKTGRVKVLGESWKADAQTTLSIGTRCVVEKLDGVTLTVRPK